MDDIIFHHWQRTHKYGIRIPKSVEEALEIDAQNRNSHWRDAIELEIPKIEDAQLRNMKGMRKTLLVIKR